MNPLELMNPNRLLLPVSALFLLASTPVFALSIDEFDGETATTSTDTFIDGSMLGGERDITSFVGTTYGSTGGQATVAYTAGFAQATITYDGNDDSAANAFGLGGVDLTAGGADRFLLSVTSVSNIGSMQIFIDDSFGNAIRNGAQDINSAGLYEFAFNTFTFSNGSGANFNNVNAIRLVFSSNVDARGPASLTMDYLRTDSAVAVPEPSTFALLGLTLAVAGVWRRQRSAG